MMAKPLGLNRLVLLAAAAAILLAATVAWTQSEGLTITLAGQSMIRSDLRVTDPAAMPLISSLLKGDVKFTNFEGVIAKPGQPNDSVPETRPNGGWLDPPGTIGALKSLGFNLVSLSNNHAWDLKAVGIQNTLEEAKASEFGACGHRRQFGRGCRSGLSPHRQGHGRPDRHRFGRSCTGRRGHCDATWRERTPCRQGSQRQRR